MSVIYLDVLVALNFLIDYLLLWGTARVLRHPCKRWRMVVAALLGGIGACVILLPPLSFWLQTAIRLGIGNLLVLVAFSWNGPVAFVKQTVVLFVVSALFAGISAALWFFAAPQGLYVYNGVVYYDVSPLLLTALSVIGYGAVCVYDRLTQKHRPAGKIRYAITVCFDGRETTLATLLDTGHHVTEAFSGSPVVMVDRQAVSAILPPETAVLSGGLSGAATAVRWHVRMIPCRTVGGSTVLPALCPDRMCIADGTGVQKTLTGAYIALCDGLGRGEYQALIGNDIADLFT